MHDHVHESKTPVTDVLDASRLLTPRKSASRALGELFSKMVVLTILVALSGAILGAGTGLTIGVAVKTYRLMLRGF